VSKGLSLHELEFGRKVVWHGSLASSLELEVAHLLLDRTGCGPLPSWPVNDAVGDVAKESTVQHRSFSGIALLQFWKTPSDNRERSDKADGERRDLVFLARFNHQASDEVVRRNHCPRFLVDAIWGLRAEHGVQGAMLDRREMSLDLVIRELDFPAKMVPEGDVASGVLYGVKEIGQKLHLLAVTNLVLYDTEFASLPSTLLSAHALVGRNHDPSSNVGKANRPAPDAHQSV
jgi:hypothetical protein